MPFQPAGETVFIEDWEADEDFGIHPKGSQPKRVVTCPTNVLLPYLIPGHRYIFKTAKKDWQAQQMWSEVVAYRIACLANLRAPPCFAAVDRSTGEVGVLMEFFFSYPGEQVTPRLAHGGDVLARYIADRKRGRPHGVKTNVSAARAYKVPRAVEWWGEALVFDALIANVDRHPDNWAFLVVAGEQQTYSMAPLFDNGTSLGYGITDAKLAESDIDTLLTPFAARGPHHCGWDGSDDKRGAHVALVARFAATYPRAIGAMQNVIRFDIGAVESIVTGLIQFQTGVPFTAERAQFILALIAKRQDELAEVLGL